MLIVVELAGTSTVDGADILTSNTTLKRRMGNINNRPSGLDDGNALDALSCTDGQIISNKVDLGPVLNFLPFWMLIAMDLCSGVIVMTTILLLETLPMMVIVMVL